MKSLEDLLDEEFRAPEAKLYFELAEEDERLLGHLIETRRHRMTQAEVAEAMGVTQATVSAFERLGNDPKLSTVRRYAKAVGVMVRHHFDDSPGSCSGSAYLSHVTKDGVGHLLTAAALRRSFQAETYWPGETGTEDQVAQKVTGGNVVVKIANG